MLRLVRMMSWLGVIGLGLGLLFSSLRPGIVLAHGKEITIEVSPLTPDTQQPRTRLYRAFVFFTGDREPVEGAVIALTARRRQGGEVLPPVRLEPLNIPGFYAAQVSFTRYGTWEIKLEVKEPGEGEVNFVEEVMPAPIPRETEAADRGGGSSVFTLSLPFSWRDVANLAIRWVHSLAAAAWFGLSGLIVAAFWFLEGEVRARFLGRLYHLFPFVAAASLALLAGTGVYNSTYNSVLTPPGSFKLDLMRQLPYGTAYLAALGLKVLTMVAGVGLALVMARGLKLAAAVPARDNPMASEGQKATATGKRPSLLSLAVANLALGLLMLLNTATLIYLHNLMHLAIRVPGG